MAKKLFVGGLSWGTTDDVLRDGFARFGRVTDAKVITDRDTGRSRGFGFVTFEQDEDADAAMSALDGQAFDGRTIKVNEAESKGRGGSGGPRGGFRGGDDRGNRGPRRGHDEDRW